MASFTRLPSDNWRALVRRKGHVLSETFSLKKDAEAWARRIESEIDAGKTPARKDVAGVKTFGALIDLHIEDMKEVGKPLGRTKAYSLEFLKNRLGRCEFENLDRERIIQFGKDRANDGAGPVTVSMDVGYTHSQMKKSNVDSSVTELAWAHVVFTVEQHDFRVDKRLLTIGLIALATFIGVQFFDRRLELAAGSAAIVFSVALDRKEDRVHALQSLHLEVYMTLVSAFVMARRISGSLIGDLLHQMITVTHAQALSAAA